MTVAAQTLFLAVGLEDVTFMNGFPIAKTSVTSINGVAHRKKFIIQNQETLLN
jgi:hypothetical protein